MGINPNLPQQTVSQKDLNFVHTQATKEGYKGTPSEFIKSPEGQEKFKAHFKAKAQVEKTQAKGMSKIRWGGVIVGVGIALLKAVALAAGAGALGASMMLPVGWAVLGVGLAIMAKGASQARTSGAGVEAKSYASILANSAAAIAIGTFGGLLGAQGGALYNAGSFKDIGNIVLGAAKETGAMFGKIPYATWTAGNASNLVTSEGFLKVVTGQSKLANSIVLYTALGVGAVSFLTILLSKDGRAAAKDIYKALNMD